MIQIKKRYANLYIPVYNRKSIPASGVFLVLCYNTFTKDSWLFKCRDTEFQISKTKTRLHLSFELPKDFREGTYNVYTVSFEDWISPEIINANSPAYSHYFTDKGAITFDDTFIVAGGMIITTGLKKANIIGYDLVLNEDTQDRRVSGNLCEKICVLGTDMMNYNCQGSNYISKDYDNNKNDKIIAYEG